MSGSRSRLILSTIVGATIGVGGAVGLAYIWHGPMHKDSDLHQMLHEAVPLDAREQTDLDEKERIFAARRGQIEVKLRTANANLADAIASDPRWSPRVEAATRQVEQAAADLQRATLVHVFEMRAGLEPEHRAAYDKVLIDALRQESR
jgi:nickel and cobalt resistance protein CnrR